MSWMDSQDYGSKAKAKVEVRIPELEICIDGEHWIPINKHSVDKCYTDSMPRLLIVVDEIAELTGKSGLKSAEGKREDALKDEIVSNIQSITQLGRSSGIHCILCTQRNDAAIDKNYELTIKRNNIYQTIKWFELQIGDEFADGSRCTYLSNWFKDITYKVYIDNDYIICSAGHLLKIDIKDNNTKRNDSVILPRSISARKAINEYSNDWVSVEDLYNIMNHKLEVYTPNLKLYSNNKLITNIELLGESEVRCIQTNTGHYLIKDFISHNTVIPGIIQNNPLSLDTLVEVKD